MVNLYFKKLKLKIKSNNGSYFMEHNYSFYLFVMWSIYLSPPLHSSHQILIGLSEIKRRLYLWSIPTTLLAIFPYKNSYRPKT